MKDVFVKMTVLNVTLTRTLGSHVTCSGCITISYPIAGLDGSPPNGRMKSHDL